MSQTIAQVRNRALRKIGKIAIGQTPDSDIADDMEEAYNQVYARLKRRGMVTWSSTGSIPDDFVEDIVALMAVERGEGIPAERYQRILIDAERALINIAASQAGKWVNPREYTDF